MRVAEESGSTTVRVVGQPVSTPEGAAGEQVPARVRFALNQEYVSKVLTMTHEVNQEFESHYNRQKEKRQEKVYNDFDFRDVISEINTSNIQNIMTKKIMRLYLNELHTTINNAYTVTQTKLTERTIFDAYYNIINILDDILDCHLELIRCLE